MTENLHPAGAATEERRLGQRLYDWAARSADTRKALWALGGLGFLQSLILPVPPDLLLIPLVLARRAKAWLFASIATFSSVAGGIAGYVIGYFLFETLGEPLLALWGYEDSLETFEHFRNEWGVWVVAAGAFTPLPYKLVAIASGAADLDVGIFILASLGARGVRFFGETALLRHFGPTARRLIERRLGAALLLGLVLLVAGVLAGYFFA